MEEKIKELLQRSVSEINVKESLEKKLKSGKKLKIKFGIDPTGYDLTIGHAVPLRKLKQFQELGHEIIFLIGGFTAQIGDPTGKDQTRKILTKQDVQKNAETYLEQASKILDVSKIKIVNNSDWLEKLNFQELLKLAGSYTVSQMLQRDMFKKRISEGREINLVEFLYPLMQGYDSVELKADIEIGGNDQFFNLMAGRVIQQYFGQDPQDILTTPLLVGTDGSEKMSKSLGNYIAINDTPREKFGKTMSIPDELIPNYFELATEILLLEINEIKKDLKTKNPRDLKVRLAKEIVALYHGADEAEKALAEFEQMFKKGGQPDQIEKKKIDLKQTSPIEIIFALGLVESKSEARRAISAGSVKLNGEKITGIEEEIQLESGAVFQVGKRKWAEVA